MQFNVRAQNHRCAPPCWWATGSAWEGHRDSEWVCPTRIAFLFFLSFITVLSLSLSFFQMHTLLLLHGEESKSRAQRGGHTATFLSMLCWLGWTLPLRGWWGRMALWRNQPGASIAVIIIWIQDCWICSFGPLRGWEMTCLCSPDTRSVYSETTHPPSTTTLPCSTLSARVDECFFNDWHRPSIKTCDYIFHPCLCLWQSPFS